MAGPPFERKRLHRHRVVVRLALPAVAVPWLGLLGEHWWAFDLCAHFPWPCLWVLVLLALVLGALRQARWALLCLPTVGLCSFQLWPLWTGDQGKAAGTAVRVLTANLAYDNRDPERLQPFVRAQNPDIVVLTEFTAAIPQLLRELRGEFPHRVEAPRPGAFGIALWSRLPLERGEVVRLGSDSFPAIAAIVTTATGPLGVLAVHPPPPAGASGSARRDLGLGAIPRLLAGLPTPHVVVGDLNATRWCAPFAQLIAAARLRDGSEGHGHQGSWPALLPAPLRIPIDHVLVSEGVAVARHEVGPEFGSDHVPVFAELRLLPNGR